MRSLVATQEMANAMTGAMNKGHSLLPQRHTGKCVELNASSAYRELSTAKCKVTLEHKGEVVLLPLSRITQSNSTGNVGSTVEVLCTAVHKEQPLALQGTCALGRGSVVNYGTMLAIAGNHLKAVATIEVALAAL